MVLIGWDMGEFSMERRVSIYRDGNVILRWVTGKRVSNFINSSPSWIIQDLFHLRESVQTVHFRNVFMSHGKIVQGSTEPRIKAFPRFCYSPLALSPMYATYKTFICDALYMERGWLVSVAPFVMRTIILSFLRLSEKLSFTIHLLANLICSP